MLRMPAHSLGVAGLVGIAVLWAIPITLVAFRVRRAWRRWSTPLPVLLPPLKQQQSVVCEAAQLRRSFPRCLPDPSPVPRTKRLENTNR